MINKKLLAVVSIAATIATSSAFAKTEGNYAGLDLLATKNKTLNSDNSRSDNIDYGVGVNYKYAFNFNNIFIAPGAFLNQNNAEARDDLNGVSKLKYSYGAKLDLGYDITDKVATFVTFGYQESRHKDTGLDNSTQEALIYGVGAKYSVSSNVDVALAYEYSNFNKSGSANSLNPEVLKLGFAYKF